MEWKIKKWVACFWVLICALSVGCQSEQAPAVAEVPKADIQTKPPNQDKKFALRKISEILLVEDPDVPIGVNKSLRIDQDRIYLMDTSQKRIMVFTTDGQFVRSIGRQGGGPGEFRQLFTMDVRDGLIASYDQARHRITLFDTSGVFLNSFGARTKESVPAGNCIIITSNRTLLLCSESVKSPKKQMAEHNYPWLICEFDTLGNVLSTFAPYNKKVLRDELEKLERPLKEYEFSFAQFRAYSPTVTYLWLGNIPIVVAYKGRQSIEKTTHVKTALTKPKFREQKETVGQQQRPTPASIRARMEQLRKNPRIVTNISDVLFDGTHSILLVLQQRVTLRGGPPERAYFLSIFDYDSGQNVLTDMRFPRHEEQPTYVRIDMDADGAIYCIENDAPDNYVIGKYRLVEESARKE